ncbi:hypothetical protein P3L51_29700 [Streptomyces sp. PSRA5]
MGMPQCPATQHGNHCWSAGTAALMQFMHGLVHARLLIGVDAPKTGTSTV